MLDDAGEILPPSEKKRRVEESGLLPGICFSVVRKGPRIPWEKQRDRDFDRAIARWSFVIIKWSEVRPNLLVCRSLLDCDTIEERTDVLKDWLHPKAPGTLLKRVNSCFAIIRAKVGPRTFFRTGNTRCVST